MKTLCLSLLTICCLAGCGTSSGPPIPAIVEGDSMAPTVCGNHLEVSCVECQFDFKTELIAKAGFELTCPNCGYDKLNLEDASENRSAEIELLPFQKFPRRWDIVGFYLPDESEKETAIKRIVGLPGETISIRDGDLYSGDRILRKSWETQKEVRIPVFDSKCDAISPFDNSRRFRFANEMFGWETRGSELRFASGNDTTRWLNYVQWRNCRRNGKRDDEFPIEDYCGFNQQLVRSLNATRDIMLQLDVEFENDSTIAISFARSSGKSVFEITKTEKEFLISWNGSTTRKPLVYQRNLAEELPRAVIEFSSVDQALYLRINGNSVFELRENEEPQAVADRASDFFQIGGVRGSFRIERFQLWRDLCYLEAPAGFEPEKDLKLGAGKNEYILLGDNPPRSLDSRVWKKPGIPRSNLIGRLVLPSNEQ